MASCIECKNCGMDMDMDPFCVKAEVLAKRTEITGKTYPWGLDSNHASALCKGEFFEPRKPKEPS